MANPICGTGIWVMRRAARLYGGRIMCGLVVWTKNRSAVPAINLATYTGLFDHVRKFVALIDSQRNREL